MHMWVFGFFCIYSYFSHWTFVNFQQTNVYRFTDYFHASRQRRRHSSCLASQEETGDFCPTFGSPWGVFIWQQSKTTSEMQVWVICCIYFVPIFILTIELYCRLWAVGIARFDSCSYSLSDVSFTKILKSLQANGHHHKERNIFCWKIRWCLSDQID